jgi:hypothetical protein
VQWCSLCHADLRPEEEREAARLAADSARQAAEGRLSGTGPAADGSDGPDGSDRVADLLVGVGSGGGAGVDVEGAPVAAPRRGGRHARPSPVPVDPAGPAPQPAPGRAAAVPATDPTGATDTTEADRALRAAGVDVAGMLELLAADQDRSWDALTGRMSNKGQRTLYVCGAVVLLTAAGLLALFVLGTIFG